MVSRNEMLKLSILSSVSIFVFLVISGHLFKKRKSQWNQFHFKLKSSHWWMKCRIQSFPTKIEYSRIESFYNRSPQFHFWATTRKADGPVISISDVPFRYSCGLFIHTHQVVLFLVQVNKIGQNFRGIIIFVSVVRCQHLSEVLKFNFAYYIKLPAADTHSV